MKTLSWLATGIAFSGFLVGVAHAAPPAPQARWTIMVYMSGDNNLEDYIVKDIELELGLAGSDANIQIVALADRGPGYDTSRGNWQTTKLYHVTQGIVADAASAVADWGERNFGDPQTLIDFVTWTKTNYPADRYALYFWGHGWNWHPGWVMEDDTDVDTLDYHEMKAAIPQLGFIDVVGYDGCNMATLEIYKLWQNKATAIAASEEYVGWNGIEYDSVIAQLRANPFMSADQVAVATRPVGDHPGRRAHLVGGGGGRAADFPVDGDRTVCGRAHQRPRRQSQEVRPARSVPRARCGRRRWTRISMTWRTRSISRSATPTSRRGRRA